MMPVPAAFKTAPRNLRPDGSGMKCACGSSMVAARTGSDPKTGKEGGIGCATPVRWCNHCKLPAFDGPVNGQTERRVGGTAWACDHCGGRMLRLIAQGCNSDHFPIPLSYCHTCVSVSFRPVYTRGDRHPCEMCQTDVPVSNRWCGTCYKIVDVWRKAHGPIPKPGDPRLEKVLWMAMEHAAELGWTRKKGVKRCMVCRKKYRKTMSHQRRCPECIEAGRFKDGVREDLVPEEGAGNRARAEAEAPSLPLPLLPAMAMQQQQQHQPEAAA